MKYKTELKWVKKYTDKFFETVEILSQSASKLTINTRAGFEIYSKLTIKTPERRH